MIQAAGMEESISRMTVAGERTPLISRGNCGSLLTSSCLRMRSLEQVSGPWTCETSSF